MPKSLFFPPPVRAAIAEHIKESVGKAEDGYLSAHEDEDALTGHLGGSLRISNQTVVAVGPDEREGLWTWSVDYTKFRGRGKQATEKVIGADGIFEIRLQNRDQILRKSLLFQAKKEWENDPNLFRQSLLLSNWREAAFVLNYSPTGFQAIELDGIVASRGKRPPNIVARPLSEFLAHDFVDCIVGDTALRYDAQRRILSWLTMSGETVTTRFITRHRFRINVSAPQPHTLNVPRIIKHDEIFRHRMSAEYEDVLGVRATAPEKDKAKARNALAQTYHPDQLNVQDDFLRFLATERMKEINFAYDQLKKPKK